MKVPSGVEQRLVKRLQDGEKTAAREFYTLYADYLAGICSRYIADEDDLKDAFQDAFIHILTNIADIQYRGEGSLKSWAAKVTVNQSLKFLRTKGKLQQVHQAIEVPDETEEDDQPQREVETTSPPTPLPWARGDKIIAGTETLTKTGTGTGTTPSSGTSTETITKTKPKKLAKTESETDVPAESGVLQKRKRSQRTLKQLFLMSL